MLKRLASAVFGIAFLADLVVILAFAQVLAPQPLTEFLAVEHEVQLDRSDFRVGGKEDMPNSDPQSREKGIEQQLQADLSSQTTAPRVVR